MDCDIPCQLVGAVDAPNFGLREMYGALVSSRSVSRSPSGAHRYPAQERTCTEKQSERIQRAQRKTTCFGSRWQQRLRQSLCRNCLDPLGLGLLDSSFQLYPPDRTRCHLKRAAPRLAGPSEATPGSSWRQRKRRRTERMSDGLTARCGLAQARSRKQALEQLAFFLLGRKAASQVP